MPSINILLVEDHVLTRMGTKAALNSSSKNCQVVAEAGSVKEAKDILKNLPKIDLVLLDLILPDGNGIEVVQFMRLRNMDNKVLIISADTDKNNILQLVQLGINGFISKFADISTLEYAVESVCNGNDYFGKDISEIIHAVTTAKSPEEELFTARELEIIRLCTQGHSVKIIADELNISTRTVENHKNNIFKKMGFNSTGELIYFAFEKGIVQNI